MGDKSAIEWTDATWNPIRGCSRVSEGCRNCYAERMAGRQINGAYKGLVRSTGGGWTGEVRFVEDALDRPLRWKAPRRIFVNSMSDLFHEKVTESWIAQIFNVMRSAEQHTFQVLTKRPERMRDLLSRWAASPGIGNGYGWVTKPLPNVWLGASVEDQAMADERIPLLLQTPAAVRWVSSEPALGRVDFHRWLYNTSVLSGEQTGGASLDWLVVGGESGPGARPFDLAWARSAIAQCRAAGVPCFVKQLGAHPHYEQPSGRMFCGAPQGLWARQPGCGAPSWSRSLVLRDRKGGDMAEFPEDLKVREYPR